jgi:hypothetical protein
MTDTPWYPHMLILSLPTTNFNRVEQTGMYVTPYGPIYIHCHLQAIQAQKCIGYIRVYRIGEYVVLHPMKTCSCMSSTHPYHSSVFMEK